MNLIDQMDTADKRALLLQLAKEFGVADKAMNDVRSGAWKDKIEGPFTAVASHRTVRIRDRHGSFIAEMKLRECVPDDDHSLVEAIAEQITRSGHVTE